MRTHPNDSWTISGCGSLLTWLKEKIDPSSRPIHLSIGFLKRSRAPQPLLEQGKQLVKPSDVNKPTSRDCRRPLLFQPLVQPLKLFADSKSLHWYLNFASMFNDRADEVLAIQFPCEDNDPV